MSTPIASGSLLIARPPLDDSNFEGTVVLLCAHEEDATVGLVLNRPLELAVPAVLPGEDLGEAGAMPLLWGGPVGSDQLILLHDSPASAAIGRPVHAGIHFGGGVEAARRLAAAGGWLRFFLGYSGWSGGQLQDELDHGSWYLLPPDEREVWTTDWRWQWERLIARADPSLAWMRQAEHPESN
jgi:putative transcriptional regulator